MSWTRVGIALGIVALGLVLFVAVVGSTALRAPLLALVALVVLVAGGNWLNDWLGIRRAPPQFNQPDRHTPPEDEER